jgi:hypothetical protein
LFIGNSLLLVPRQKFTFIPTLCKASVKPLFLEKMRHHVKEMCQVYIASVKAMFLLIELGKGLTETCRLPVMKIIWYRVET